MRKMFFLLLFICDLSALIAQYEEHKTPDQIEQELQSAEEQFQRALKMFNPWYTGPLQAPSATVMALGKGNFQTYLNLMDNYAHFDEERHSHDRPSHLIDFYPILNVRFGMTKSTDIKLGIQSHSNWQYDHSGSDFGDTAVTMGFMVTSQTVHVPAIKFCIREIFPTGRYQHLHSNGLKLNSAGKGSFQTQFSLNLSKVLFWNYLHPLNVRLSLGYNFAVPVRVHGFNAYGGGYGANARVHPGNIFSADMGIELSLTQRWVIANDIVYSTQRRTTYSGYAGTTSSGAHASIGSNYSDNLSLAPAIEYNWNENIGVLGGVWFSVYGRNSSNFATGIISVTWTFRVK